MAHFLCQQVRFFVFPQFGGKKGTNAKMVMRCDEEIGNPVTGNEEGKMSVRYTGMLKREKSRKSY